MFGRPQALLVAPVLVGVLLSASVARAQGGSNEAAAEALFNDGRALVAAGRVEEGCKKLEASQALDPGAGTLIHVADCQEKLGRTATAWARFREAASRAARDGRADWEAIARARAAELEPKLAKLRVEAPSGAAVRRGDQDIPAAALGTALPIDPGEYVIVASQPGKKSWTAKVRVESARVASVVVPALEDDPAAAQPSKRDATSAPGGSTPLRTVGFAVGAVGLVGLAVGGVAGLSAISLNQRSKQQCPEDGVCADEGARSDNERARTAATISTIGFIAGGTLFAGGLALVVFAPSSTAGTGAGRLRVSARGVHLEGAW